MTNILLNLVLPSHDTVFTNAAGLFLRLWTDIQRFYRLVMHLNNIKY